MTRDEIRALLGVVASFNQRTYATPDVTAWHLALGDISSFDDAAAAVVRHFNGARSGTGQVFITPGDVRHGVGLIRADRLERQTVDQVLTVPDHDPDDPVGWKQAMLEGRTRVADGTERPRPVRQLTADAFHVVPKPDYGTRGRFDPVGLRDRARRRAEIVEGRVVVDSEAT